MQTKHYKILLLFIFPLTQLFSQNNHGFAFDNYSGIYGVISNPANSVDSKYKIHINVVSYNQLGVSDIGSLTNLNIETAPNGFNGLAFEENLMNGKNDGYAYSNNDILLPSIVWNFHENFAAGLLLRTRTLFDYNNFNSDLLKAANEGFPDDPIEDFNNQTLNNTAQSWTEIGLNLSAVLINSNYHFVKFGGTFKYYIGRGSNEVRGSLAGSYNGSELSLNTGVADSLVSVNTFPSVNQNDETSKSFINSAFNSFSGEGSGIGGDLGIVYEWRPRETNRVDVRSNSSAVNKYKLKISASVLDIGLIKYEDALKNSYSITNAIINKANLNTSGGLITSIDNEISNSTVSKDSKIGEATFALPRSLHLNLDYIILNNKNYYININYIKSLTTSTDKFANTQLNLITVTPRFETRKLSVYLPINFEPTSGITAGLGVRYGPVTIGAAALSSMLTEGKMQHLYFGVSIPLMKELTR